MKFVALRDQPTENNHQTLKFHLALQSLITSGSLFWFCCPQHYCFGFHGPQVVKKISYCRFKISLSKRGNSYDDDDPWIRLWEKYQKCFIWTLPWINTAPRGRITFSLWMAFLLLIHIFHSLQEKPVQEGMETLRKRKMENVFSVFDRDRVEQHRNLNRRWPTKIWTTESEGDSPAAGRQKGKNKRTEGRRCREV